jgi:hypothetical protein
MACHLIADLNLLAARNQMAVSLGFHIIVACLGIGFPLVTLIAHWRRPRTQTRSLGEGVVRPDSTEALLLRTPPSAD